MSDLLEDNFKITDKEILGFFWHNNGIMAICLKKSLYRLEIHAETFIDGITMSRICLKITWGEERM